jgi:hypothetical protein
MYINKILTTICFVLIVKTGIAAEQSLEIEAVYSLGGVKGLQPSGLALCNDKVVFVSDKHESKIFELIFEKNSIAHVKIWRDLGQLPEPPEQKLGWWLSTKRFLGELFGLSNGADWEGITCNDLGDIFLASEYYFSVLKVDSTGKKEWLVDNLYQKANKAGLFKKDNAYIEGITANGTDLLLAAEREPRGFITISGKKTTFYVQPGPLHSSQNLPFDYSGLYRYQDKIVALERNHYRVCEIETTFEPVMCYSFKKTAKSLEWGYSTGKYGLAEGLAISDDSLWIIVDNNGDSRLNDPEDNQPIIMKFKNPILRK